MLGHRSVFARLIRNCQTRLCRLCHNMNAGSLLVELSALLEAVANKKSEFEMLFRKMGRPLATLYINSSYYPLQNDIR